VRAPSAAPVGAALLTMSGRAQLRANATAADLIVRAEEIKLSEGVRVFGGLVELAALRIEIGGIATEVTASGTSSGAAGGASTAGGGGGGGSPVAGGRYVHVRDGRSGVNHRQGRPRRHCHVKPGRQRRRHRAHQRV
jgi:hypothetical protein